MDFSESIKLYEEARGLIPGGVTSSRRPIKFVEGKYPISLAVEKARIPGMWMVTNLSTGSVHSALLSLAIVMRCR